MSEEVLVIGGGGREHAIVWKLSQSPQVGRIFAAPGSYGISRVKKAQNVELDVKNHKQIINFCKENGVKLVVVGPEDPLANGIANDLLANNLPVFGPTSEGARIESDKNWSKAFMDRHEIPTARWKSFSDATQAKNFIKTASFDALVVKASGLAAGKGVVVAADQSEACQAVDDVLTLNKFGAAGEIVVVEELLEGEEVSVLAFSDGNTVKAMLPAQDHKRIFDGDQGPNTGGMGAYCPCPLLSNEQVQMVEKQILQKVIEGFKKENIKFIGILYAGLMLTRSGPKVLEFNCRFGDPETEVILPLLQTDLYSIMAACCHGDLAKINLEWKPNVSTVGVVLASQGYPETSTKNQPITNWETANSDELIFHCGTAFKNDSLVTNGGRVLIAVSLASHLPLAAVQATKLAQSINFPGKQYRKDIAFKGISRSILQSGTLTYKQSGVDITAGNELVSHIKPAAKSTDRVGVMGGLGGFGGLFDLKLAGFKDPILVSGTDGVGTKLKIAQEVGLNGTIGIDLVAMCVNDVLANGAEPLFFLDYFACGKLDVETAKQIVDGVAEGCRQAGASLIGGETAEMPQMYKAGEYDLAGFAVGAVERSEMIPRMNEIKQGDVVIALESSGVHSNGFSLVRKVVQLSGFDYRDPAPFSKTSRTFGEEFLTPTKIYVKSVIPAVKTGKVKAFAHITGGGLLENIPRVLRNDLGVVLDAEKWEIPPVFAWLATMGQINNHELLRTFNCGIGGILIVDEKSSQEILKIVNGKIIGSVVEAKTKEQVTVINFDTEMERKMRPFVPTLVSKIAPKKKVGVLISGSGTNLQSLIDTTQSRDIGADIVLVISNKDGVEGLKRAERAGIPTKVISHKDYPNRSDFDLALHGQLLEYGVEIVCLAGFMRILTGEFTRKWKGRLINVHPALLPLFKGTHAQKQALEAGVRVSGCTVHFVDETVDGGHIITQEAVPVLVDDTEETLTERIKLAEHQAFPRALEWIAKGKVILGSDNKLIWQ